jgi:pimeloyl-ACP methyl ester carboxylesterase
LNGPVQAPWTLTRTVDGAGTPIYIREVGQGPPLVLLHGFPQTGECWRAVAAALAPKHRVIVPDLPGYGASGRPPAFDAATIARTLVAAMADAGAPRATVVGHDWGGAIAYRIAGAHTEAVERLVVVNAPYGKVDLRRGWYMLAFNVPVLPELAMTLSRGGIVEWFLRAGSAGSHRFDPEMMDAYRDAFRTLERQRNALAYYRTMTRQAMLRPLRRSRSGGGAKITAPTLIVWGEDDPALPVKLVDGIIRAIPGARVERIPNVGHFVPEEAPTQLAALIEGFAED